MSLLVIKICFCGLRLTGFLKAKCQGFSITSALISVVIIGIAFSAIVSMLSTQSKESLFIRQQVSGSSLKYLLLQVLHKSASDTCSCHFNPTKRNPQPDPNKVVGFNIDTTQEADIDDIDLGTLRSGCDFSDPAPPLTAKNIIVQAGKELKDELLTVKSVKVSDIQPTAETNQYKGDLVIKYEGSVRPLRPLKIPLILVIDLNSGEEKARPIKSCWAIDQNNESCYTVEEGHEDDHSSKGRTLVGCGGTANAPSSKNATAFGYAAGAKNKAQNDITFIGYRAGENNTGRRNTFVGPEAGQNNSIDLTNANDKNIIKDTKGGGHRFDLEPEEYAGDNVFIGYQTGKNNKGESNIFIGNQAGWESTGSQNVFTGHQAGWDNTTGKNNVFIGTGAGGTNTTGTGNTFIGYQAGAGNTTGSHNIFLGAGTFGDADQDNQFVVGNAKHKRWLTGTIGGASLYVDGNTVTINSSRTLKKNIKPFKDFKRALEDLLKTPLFTYEYKHRLDHPEKSRMGIISEELPEHLQLKRKGHLSHPDWPSIYGSFWAGIKALYEMLGDFKKNVLSKIESLKSRLEGVKKSQERSVEELIQVQSELVTTKTELSATKGELQEQKVKFDRTYKELEDTQTEIEETKKALQKQLAEMMRRLPNSKEGKKKVKWTQSGPQNLGSVKK